MKIAIESQKIKTLQFHLGKVETYKDLYEYIGRQIASMVILSDSSLEEKDVIFNLLSDKRNRLDEPSSDQQEESNYFIKTGLQLDALEEHIQSGESRKLEIIR